MVKFPCLHLLLGKYWGFQRRADGLQSYWPDIVLGVSWLLNGLVLLNPHLMMSKSISSMLSLNLICFHSCLLSSAISAVFSCTGSTPLSLLSLYENRAGPLWYMGAALEFWSCKGLSIFSFLCSRKLSALHRIIKMFSIVTFWNTFQMWNCSADKRAGQGEDQLWQMITALLSHNYSALPQCLTSEFSYCKLLIATGVKTKKIIMLTPSEQPPTHETRKKIFNYLWWLHLNPYNKTFKSQNPY